MGISLALSRSRVLSKIHHPSSFHRTFSYKSSQQWAPCLTNAPSSVSCAPAHLRAAGGTERLREWTHPFPSHRHRHPVRSSASAAVAGETGPANCGANVSEVGLGGGGGGELHRHRYHCHRHCGDYSSRSTRRGSTTDLAAGNCGRAARVASSPQAPAVTYR